MESAEENDLDDERIKMYRKSIKCTRISIVIFVDPEYLDDEWWEKVNDYYEDYCALSAHMTDDINLRLIVQSFFIVIDDSL